MTGHALFCHLIGTFTLPSKTPFPFCPPFYKYGGQIHHKPTVISIIPATIRNHGFTPPFCGTVGPDERLLDAADMHASHYFASLRDFELPRYNLSCSEKRLILHDKIKDRTIHFPLCELEQHINVFFFLAGVESLPSGDSGSQARTDAGFKIVQMLYHLMKGLKKAGAEGSDLLQGIIRVSFCFFAENTGL